METYLKVTGILFHILLLLFILSQFIERRDMTYVARTRYVENEHGEKEKQDSCLYITIFSFLMLNFEFGMTDNNLSMKDQFSDKVFINDKRKVGVKVINSKKIVAYISLSKFWKRKKED